MSRAPVAVFAVLAAATIGAFFITQHLKVSTPLITGFPAPVPGTINPVSGGTCPLPGPGGRPQDVSFRRMQISFYLLNRPDVVDVDIVTPGGALVRRLPGSGRYMALKQRRLFTWDGRRADGTLAPDGSYDIRVTLVHQDRSLLITNQSTGALEPVTVQTHPPALRVTAIIPDAVATAGRSQVVIHFSGNQRLRPRILILRAGGSRTLKNYAATTKAGTSVWNGTLAGDRPAPPGRYLVALRLAPDRTCNRVQSPMTVAAAPQAVVGVR